MDPYVYPGTNVLKNLRDIRDDDKLSRFEAVATTRRGIELENKPLSGTFDARHLRSIHQYIFQDVYEWAGEFRTVNISKSGSLFAFHSHIDENRQRTFGELKNENCLRGTGLNTFAVRAAYYLGEINAIHPFREGNGRTQREFIRELAVHNGFDVDWRQISQQRMIEASRHSLNVDSSQLEGVLRAVLTFKRHQA